jgi:two-component system cell cycle response regulator
MSAIQAGGRSRVLVVDDSAVIRKAISRVLDSDYDLLEANNGEAGWEALKQNGDLGVVISDVQMPKLDGYGMICRIRADSDPKVRDLPVIVITSAEDDITRERAYACGANDFILKPIDSDQLLSCVRNLTGGQPATSQYASEAQMDETVIEEIDVQTALDIIAGLKSGALQPYAPDLALKVIPLLEYCNREFALELDQEIAMIKTKLEIV